jgi:hypothetical protein
LEGVIHEENNHPADDRVSRFKPAGLQPDLQDSRLGFQENTQQNVDEDAADTDDGEDDNEDAATSGNNADTDTEEVTGNDGGAQDIPSVQTDDAGNIHIEDGDSEYNWGTLSDSDIPDDYPADALPLFGLDSAALLGSNRQDMGDAGIIFIIVFGVDDDVSAVSVTSAASSSSSSIRTAANLRPSWICCSWARSTAASTP